MKNGKSIEAGSVISRSPLTAIIFIAAAVLVAVGMFVTFRAGRVSIETQRRMNNQLRVISDLQELESTVKDAETGQRGYLLTGEESYLEPYNNSIPKLKMELDALNQLVSQGEIDKEDMDQVSALISQKMAELAATVRLRKESGLPAAMDRVRTDEGKEIMDEIRANISRMARTGEDSYNQAVQRAAQANYWRNITFVSVAIVNLGFLAWAFRRISRQEWLQFGHARLNEQLAGDQNLSQLSEKTIRFLAEYLGAQVGAIAVEEGDYFRQSATYAVSNAHNPNQKFAAGEGLPGQAVKDKRAFVISSVPEGYMAVSSGLGHSQPKKLLIAPMKVDGVVNAVIELGFFNPPQHAAIELVERVSEAVGIALRSAKYRTRLQELLEETQRQSEELQTQSEELRVSNEELEEQSRALKESQARLEQQQVELEQSNSQLEEQTQLLENQKDDLSRAKSELEMQAAIVEQASRYKSDFLANMSHELRTPLNSSLILAKLLADNREGNLTSEQVKYAQTIQSAGNDLLNLINDVLDLAKVEAGHMDLNAEPFPVADLLDSLTGMFEPLVMNKGLTLKTSVAPEVPATLEADRRRLEQVLKNLLSNAVKFTERGEVSLEIRNAPDDRVAFDVRDTGIGIAENQQSIIFEPFRQADGTTDRKYGGTGLGLSISRELARLMGGSIQLSSQPGKGSVFTVVLPKRPAAAKRVPARRTAQSAQEPAAVESPTAGKKAAPVVSKKSNIPDDRDHLRGGGYIILVVEDDESFAQILLDLAHEMDFQVLVATSAEEALSLAQQFKPSAIVLDIGLPDDSGMFVLERLKGDARTRHIPVHVVSGTDYSAHALSMGAVGYMLKPVKREQLIEAFQKLEHRLTQKLRRVLVVEDDPVQLDSLRKLLGSRDVETAGVRTAADCLEKLKGTTFDCMVLDLSLPDASGFSLLETLSAEESYSFPPVIIYTGRDLSADEEQRLRKYSKSIIIKGAKSPERLLDEVTLFLHQVVSDLPAEQQRMLEHARNREAAMEGKRILVAEDDVRNIFALTSLLEPKGVKVQIARNGREALQALEKMDKDPGQRIDLVLMDIMMPEMNGLTAMREIRKNPEWENLPIIALTAKAMRDDQEQCIQAGADDYLAKPLDVEKLLADPCLDATMKSATAETEEIELRLLLEAIYQKYHYDFRGYSMASIKRRLSQAKERFDCPSFSKLQDKVLHDGAILPALLGFLTVQVSEMFRDPGYFLCLRQKVVPHLKTYPSLKVWVAGCSTGEELYSLAILFREEGLESRTIFYATDINSASLEKAQAGIYEMARVPLFTKNHRDSGGKSSLSNYYTAGYGSVVFDKSLRERAVFSDHSLVSDSVFAEMQLISCRNVLIYFNRELQDRAIGLFKDALIRKGFLGLGARESLRFSKHSAAFSDFSRSERIYQKEVA